ncbi:hypothetical protein L198_06245 [Cryptococcus wingfieldii CBS 7118]|uniref:Uncharacterized protein n=1 Tax=Cryptococcus wingfieldii CBS 7118 TaxID=1295528 RepID=A0A1E3INP5_9TREE|nr:hypothetical protein L198_06245 [Cryptococcus wingfieldii CBS 7118]ODN90227.1 hypothetical protein L198_06245 [Cryptococcus wingfieldii CBS 7118]
MPSSGPSRCRNRPLFDPYPREAPIDVQSIQKDMHIPQRAFVRCRCPSCPPAGRVMQYRTWLNWKADHKFESASQPSITNHRPAEAPTFQDASSDVLSLVADHEQTASALGDETMDGLGAGDVGSDPSFYEGYDDLPPLPPDNDAIGETEDRLRSILARWPTKIPECLIPTYSGRNENPYRHHFELRTTDPMATMPLLYRVFAAFIVFLTAFAGVAQRYGDTARAIIEVIIKLAILEDRQAT